MSITSAVDMRSHAVSPLEPPGAIRLNAVALDAMSADSRERHAGDAGAEEGGLDLGQLFGPNDRGDELHGSPGGCAILGRLVTWCQISPGVECELWGLVVHRKPHASNYTPPKPTRDLTSQTATAPCPLPFE